MNNKGFMSPVNKWEVPIIFLLLGLSMTYLGLVYNINLVCCFGLILAIIAMIKIIKIRVRGIDSAVQDEDPHTDPENMDWHSHSGKFHKIM